MGLCKVGFLHIATLGTARNEWQLPAQAGRNSGTAPE
jgi:hypothetical protein